MSVNEKNHTERLARPESLSPLRRRCDFADDTEYQQYKLERRRQITNNVYRRKRIADPDFYRARQRGYYANSVSKQGKEYKSREPQAPAPDPEVQRAALRAKRKVRYANRVAKMKKDSKEYKPRESHAPTPVPEAQRAALRAK
jgi:hypothetical protein